MKVEHCKISGSYHYVVTVAVDGSHELKRDDFASDERGAPRLLMLVQVEGDDINAATMYAGERQALAGYVVSWDRPITVRTHTSTIVRLVFVEGHKGA